MQTGTARESFLALTPDRVLEAVERSGLRCNALCYPLNSFENRVYEVELHDRSRVVAKFYRPGRWNEEQILEEHRYLAELDGEELPVCTMRAFPGGSTLQRIGEIYFCIADRRGGRAPDELDDAAVRRLGMLVARMHNVGARSDAPSRLRLGGDTYVREPLSWLRQHRTIPRPFADRYVEAASQIAAIADRALDRASPLRIHGDLHLGNVLDRDGLLRLLDFDDMLVGPAVQDVWLALPGRDPESARQRELFIDAYEQFREFDRSTLGLIEPLRGLRMVHFSAWLARRWHDPAFPLGWPHFGTHEYWEQETAELEELLDRIERGDGYHQVRITEAPHVVDDPGELLSNSDYFWDWEGDRDGERR